MVNKIRIQRPKKNRKINEKKLKHGAEKDNYLEKVTYNFLYFYAKKRQAEINELSINIKTQKKKTQ